MVLELLAAYSLIIGTIVGVEHILQHSETEPQVSSAIEAPSLVLDEAIALEEGVIPMDMLTELPENSGLAQALHAEETSHTLLGIETETENPPSNQTMTPVSFVTPEPGSDAIEGKKHSVEASSDLRKKPYDVFEAVGFEEEANDIESWAK